MSYFRDLNKDIRRFSLTSRLTYLLLFFALLSMQGSMLFAQNGNGSGDLGYDFSRHRDNVTFRNVPWGASKTEVLNIDKSIRRETGRDYLKLNSDLGDVNVDITYFFWENHLIKGTYISTENYGDFSKYIEKYKYFKDLLTKKHGAPYIDAANWQDMTYKNQPDRWMFAILRGHLEYFAIWERDGIVISIKFLEIGGVARILIEYYIPNIDDAIEKTDDSSVLEDL